MLRNVSIVSQFGDLLKVSDAERASLWDDGALD
jgi:hypothetical protein